MKFVSKFVCLLVLAGFVASCTDDSLPQKFAAAFQEGDTLTCYKLYPDSRSFIHFIDSKKLKGLEEAEKQYYQDLSTTANFTLNGVKWIVNKEKHIIDGSDGLVNVERVISNSISEKFYKRHHSLFEKWEDETRDIHRAKHINNLLPKYDKFCKVLNALKNRDKVIIKKEIPEIFDFIDKKYSNDFENASLDPESIVFDYDKGKVKELSYQAEYCRITYSVKNNQIYASGLFDKAEFEKEFASLPVKIDGKIYYYSDNDIIIFIKHATEYIKISQEYIEAVHSGNTDVANKLYPDGNFITSTTIRKNIGSPIYFDGGLSYSGGCKFEFNDSPNDAITIEDTYRLYDYSSYYSQYLAMDGATKLDLSESSHDKWNYNEIRDAIRNLSRAKDSKDVTNEAQRPQNVNTGGWEKGYVKDEFGNIDESRPYIYQIWPGRRNDSFDCNLGIRITRDFIQFTITEDYQEPLLSGVKVTAQLNGKKFQINYDGVENESVYIKNNAEVRKVLNALDTDGTLMLSFHRTDSFEKTHNYLFTIYGSTSVSGAIQKFLME